MHKEGPIRTLRNLLIAANLVVYSYPVEAAIMTALKPSEKPSQSFNYDRALFDKNGKVIFENPTPCGEIGEPACIPGKFFTEESPDL